jgi:DNA (cytosine-5)-methyltransferase 1
LFSGCGGFDLGFVRQGFNPCAAFDSDGEAVKNFKSNIGPDVHQVDLTKELPRKEYIEGIDVLIAGPPCQGFSTAGKRAIDDSRNHLLTLTADLAKAINPKVLVVENVAGALAGEHARYWTALDRSMRA